MSNKPARITQPRARRNVRVGALERTMEDFNSEMGQKVMLSFQKYHDEYIEPRLSWLETPWYQKLWIRTKGVATRAWGRVKAEFFEPEVCDCGVGEPHKIGLVPECKYLMKELPDVDK